MPPPFSCMAKTIISLMLLEIYEIRDGLHMVSCDFHLISYALNYSHWGKTIYSCILIVFLSSPHNLRFMFAAISVEFLDIYGLLTWNSYILYEICFNTANKYSHYSTCCILRAS